MDTRRSCQIPDGLRRVSTRNYKNDILVEIAQPRKYIGSESYRSIDMRNIVHRTGKKHEPTAFQTHPQRTLCPIEKAKSAPFST